MMQTGLVMMLMAILTPALPDSQSPASRLEQAVKAYAQALDTDDALLRQERFRQSARLFSHVIDQTNAVNADLQFNLGNAALQSQQLGIAIAAYRRALAIEPGHQQAKRNLTYARRMLPDSIPRPQQDSLFDTFFTWHRTLSRGKRAVIAALSFALACILLAIAIRWRRAWARNTALLPVAVWLAMISLTLWELRPGSGGEAVVIAPSVTVRAADSSGAPPRFAQPLPAGVEAVVIEQRGDWSQIQLANGRDGWVRTSAIVLVDP